jgi:hypothetical protein
MPGSERARPAQVWRDRPQMAGSADKDRRKGPSLRNTACLEQESSFSVSQQGRAPPRLFVDQFTDIHMARAVTRRFLELDASPGATAQH